MKQARIKPIVIWEVITPPDAQARLAAAFTMLLGTLPPTQELSDKNLDSQD